MNVKRFLMMVATIVLASINSNQAFAEIYRWVDENGQTRFSDRPVKGTKASTVNVDTTKNSYGGGTVLNRQRDLLNRYDEQDLQAKKDKQQAALDKAQQEQNKKDCLRAKDRLATFERSKIYNLDENGERVYQSETKRTQTIENLRKRIQNNCAG